MVQFIKRHMGEPDWVRVINGRDYTPEILSAIILKRLVSDAEDQIGEAITDVVITCPAYFNDSERKATMDAGKIAGLNVIGILNEPTAAALAYGMNNLDKKVKAIVYDLGGGTFDVTVLDIDGNDIKVLATDGERRLGGKDWDDMVLNHVAEKFIEEHSIDPREDLESYQDLVNKVEEAKKALSKKPKTTIFAQCAGKSAKVTVSQEEFEEMTKPLLDQTETYLDVVLKKANLTWKDVDVLLMVGGSSRMPQVPRMLARVTGKEPEKGVNADECVAIGAAYWAAILLVREAETLKEKVEAGSATTEERAQATAAAARVEEAIPEEVVGMLSGVVVQNVNSHSLGIETVQPDGTKKNLIMIKEQTPLPAQVTKIFGTFMDNQVTVSIKILEGESPDPEDCTEIGTCIISDLPANRPKGSKIAVTYKYGEDGRIEVHAKDYQTGQEARTEIKREGVGYSDDQIAEKAEDIRVLFEGGQAEGAPAEGEVVAVDVQTGESYYPPEGGEAPQDQAYAAEGQDQGYAEQPAAEGYYGAEGQDQGYAEQPAEGYAAEGAAPEGYAAEGAPQEGYAQDQGGYGEAPAQEGYAAEGEQQPPAEGEGYAGAPPDTMYPEQGYTAEGAPPAEGAAGGDQGYAAQDYAEGEEGGFADSAEYR